MHKWICEKVPEAEGREDASAARNGKRVAVVGAGPAGLTAAYQLGKAGWPATVLEADDVVGGISPFGVRTELPVFADATIFDLPNVYINGGRRGLLLEIAPGVIRETLGARPVRVAAA